MTPLSMLTSQFISRQLIAKPLTSRQYATHMPAGSKVSYIFNLVPPRVIRASHGAYLSARVPGRRACHVTNESEAPWRRVSCGLQQTAAFTDSRSTEFHSQRKVRELYVEWIFLFAFPCSNSHSRSRTKPDPCSFPRNSRLKMGILYRCRLNMWIKRL